MLAAAALFALGGVVVLRTAWGRKERSHSLNATAWLLLALAAAIGWAAAGAWGVAVTAQFPIGLALALLVWAAVRSPIAPARASNRRAGMLPERGEPAHLAQRFATFLLVAVAGLLAAVGVAIALRALALAFGASEANANTLALFVQPLAWAVLAYAVLMTPSRHRQIVTLAASAAPALAIVLIGATQ